MVFEIIVVGMVILWIFFIVGHLPEDFYDNNWIYKILQKFYFSIKFYINFTFFFYPKLI